MLCLCDRGVMLCADELETLYKNSNRIDTSHLTATTSKPTVDVDLLPSMAAIAAAHGGTVTTKDLTGHGGAGGDGAGTVFTAQ